MPMSRNFLWEDVGRKLVGLTLLWWSRTFEMREILARDKSESPKPVVLSCSGFDSLGMSGAIFVVVTPGEMLLVSSGWAQRCC